MKKAKDTVDIADFYPWNLACDIFGEEKKTPEEKLEAIGNVSPYALLKALDDKWFSDRERKVLTLRYRDGLTLEKTGEVFGVQRERIRQIQARALRKLRHPRLSRHYRLDTMERWHEAEEELSKVRLENVRLQNRLDALMEVASHKITPAELDEIEKERERKQSARIDEMELSVRSYNCLCRANIRYVKDLEGMTIEKLAKVRNLGRKSMNEVIAKAAEWGIEIKSEDGE